MGMTLMASGPKSHLSEILCLSLLTANLMKILSKLKSLSSEQHFPHYMSWETIGQVTLM